MIWQYFRIVKALMPPVFVWENVKGFISDKKGKTLKDFLEVFRSIGYHCHYEVVDTKDYGVPQHRERIYIVGFLDVDAYYRFELAPKEKLTKRLKDVLETDVDEKYYLSAEMIDYFKKNSEKNRQKGNGFSFSPMSEENVAKTLTNPALNRMDETYISVGQLNPNYKSQCNTIHDLNKECPTLCAGTHGYASGYIEAGVIGMLDIKGNDNIKRVYGVDGVAPTLSTMEGGNQEIKILQKSQSGMRYREDSGTICSEANHNDMCVVEPISQIENRLRRLTPRECLRLQDVPDSFKQVVSDSQLYKQVGNAKSRNVVIMLFRQIKRALKPTDYQRTSLFQF